LISKHGLVSSISEKIRKYYNIQVFGIAKEICDDGLLSFANKRL